MSKYIEGQPPYDGYKVYKVFHKKTGRFLAILRKTGHETTVGWAKYILETSLGRKLLEGYEAHHKDENKINDVPENLEEKEKGKHLQEHIEDRPPAPMADLNCAFCGIQFQRRLKQVRYNKKQGQTKFYCCRSHQVSGQQKDLGRAQVVHGTANAYQYHRCRCVECTEGQRVRCLAWRKSKRNGPVAQPG